MTGRDRRALVVGGAVVGLAVLLLRGLPWGVRRAVAATGELRERATVLTHARDELTNASLLRDSAARITQALVGLAPKLLSGTSPAEGGADLSAQLNLAAVRHQAKVEQVDLLADSLQAGRLGRARVHAVLETDIRGLVGFLQAIAAGDAALAVRELRIVAPDPGSPERSPEILKVEVTVEGWYVRDRAAPKAER
jgi:hypothetical protein